MTIGSPPPSRVDVGAWIWGTVTRGSAPSVRRLIGNSFLPAPDLGSKEIVLSIQYYVRSRAGSTTKFARKGAEIMPRAAAKPVLGQVEQARDLGGEARQDV